jgi:hypothetical protein
MLEIKITDAQIKAIKEMADHAEGGGCLDEIPFAHVKEIDELLKNNNLKPRD